MIKRRFYKVDHGDKSGSSSSSSSSSDGDSSSDEDFGCRQKADEEGVEEEEGQEEEAEPVGSKRQRSPSQVAGSGYESEDSSVNELEEDPTGLLVSDDDDLSPQVVGKTKDIQLNDRVKAKEKEKVSIENITTDFDDSIDNYILKCKSVFKCRLCPRIICLNEESLKAHLKSKRHARSRKLYEEGRLKLMLNSDGEIEIEDEETEQETHAERHARTIALAKELEAPDQEDLPEAPKEDLVEAQKKKKDSGRQRQSRRRKKKMLNYLEKRKRKKVRRSQPANDTKAD